MSVDSIQYRWDRFFRKMDVNCIGTVTESEFLAAIRRNKESSSYILSDTDVHEIFVAIASSAKKSFDMKTLIRFIRSNEAMHPETVCTSPSLSEESKDIDKSKVARQESTAHQSILLTQSTISPDTYRSRRPRRRQKLLAQKSRYKVREVRANKKARPKFNRKTKSRLNSKKKHKNQKAEPTILDDLDYIPRITCSPESKKSVLRRTKRTIVL